MIESNRKGDYDPSEHGPKVEQIGLPNLLKDKESGWQFSLTSTHKPIEKAHPTIQMKANFTQVVDLPPGVYKFHGVQATSLISAEGQITFGKAAYIEHTETGTYFAFSVT